MMDPACSQTSMMLDIGLARKFNLAELNELQSQIAHKQHELLVYSNAKELIGKRSLREQCLVFLADNIFVMRTREQALEILGRQIIGFQNSLEQLNQERIALEERVQLMDRLNITSEGLVEIREPVEESVDLKKPGRRIALIPLKKRKIDERGKECQQNSELSIRSTSEREPERPKEIPEEDYNKFIQLVDSLELTSSDEEKERREDLEDEDDGRIHLEQKKQESIDENEPSTDREKWKKVHFGGTVSIRPIENSTHEKCKKSILKNRSEHSPIDEEELHKMEKREQTQLVPTSKETLGDEIVERNLNRLVPGPKETLRNEVKERIGLPSHHMKPTPNKRQTKKNRPMSRWKAKKMGIPGSDEDEEGEIDA